MVVVVDTEDVLGPVVVVVVEPAVVVELVVLGPVVVVKLVVLGPVVVVPVVVVEVVQTKRKNLY